MAIKHTTIKPIRHAGVASQDRIYRSAAAIVEGAPVVFQFASVSGKIVEATDAAKGIVISQTSLTGQGPILGIALNSTTAADQDVLVALALPGRRFVASLTDLSENTGSDAGAHALALADVGMYTILHKDATTLKWVLAGKVATALPFSNANGVMAQQKFIDAVVAGAAGSTGTAVTRFYPQVLIDGLIDRVGATSNDTVNPPFGGTGGSGSTAGTPPNATFEGDPAISNSGTAKVEFLFVVENTIYG